MNKIYFAAGCFWGVQYFFSLQKGVIETRVGYANGKKIQPTYNYVANEFGIDTYVETVEVVYDSLIISLNKLLEIFLVICNPEKEYQCEDDVGIQYRNGIYWIDANSQIVCKEFKKNIEKKYEKSYIEFLDLKNFYSAEKTHQNYLVKRKDSYCNIDKKLLKNYNV